MLSFNHQLHFEYIFPIIVTTMMFHWYFYIVGMKFSHYAVKFDKDFWHQTACQAMLCFKVSQKAAGSEQLNHRNWDARASCWCLTWPPKGFSEKPLYWIGIIFEWESIRSGSCDHYSIFIAVKHMTRLTMELAQENYQFEILWAVLESQKYIGVPVYSKAVKVEFGS